MHLRDGRLLRLILLFSIVLVSLGAFQAQRIGRSSPFHDVKWDGYTFRFLPGNQMAQVMDGDGHVIGTILNMNGGLQLMPTISGADADRLRKSFEQWKAQGGEKALNENAGPQGGSGREALRAASTEAKDRAENHSIAAKPSTKTESSGGGEPVGGSSRAAVTASVPVPVSTAGNYAILNSAGLKSLGHGAAIRLDLHMLRSDPNLLEQKLYMRYFIALNNCSDKSMAKMLDNELDYPDLVNFYKPRAAEILGNLPKTVSVALYMNLPLWSKSGLTLGDYDRGRGAFPILVGGQPGTAEVPDTLSFDFGKTEYRANCAIANQVLSSRNYGAMPSYYAITLKPMSFREVPMELEAARRYIENPGSSQRGIILLVNVRLQNEPPAYMRGGDKLTGIRITGVKFAGAVARVQVARFGSAEPIATLYDDHSIPPE